MDRADTSETRSGERRAFQTSDVDLGDATQLQDAADQLAEDGALAEARLIYLALLLRSGASADAVDWRMDLWGRSGLRCLESAAQPLAQGRTALDMAIGELGSLIRLDPAPAVVPAYPPQEEPPVAETSGDRLQTAALRLLQAIHSPASAEVFTDMAVALHDLRSEVEDSPLASAPVEARGTADLGYAALRSYILDVHDFAIPPLGSPALLHALARASAAGVGGLGSRTADLARHGRDALALLQLALGHPLTAAPEAQRTRGVLLLAQRAPEWLRREMVDELADLGLRGPLRALINAALRAPGHRRDREFLQRLRDAALDLGDLQLGWDAQRLLAEGWSDDPNEWQALADIAAYRGEFAEAEALFGRALTLDPDAEHARACLEALRAGEHGRFANPGGFGSSPERRRLRAERAVSPALQAFADETRELELARSCRLAAPELAPSPPPQRCWTPDDGLHFRRLGGRRERSLWGELPALAGIDAVRGFYVSDRPMQEVSVRLGGRLLARSAPVIHPVMGEDRGRRKSVFNLWIDLSAFAPGRYELELRVSDGEAVTHVHREHVLVQAAVSEHEAATSDTVADPPGVPTPSLEAAINARPSQVRPARRALVDPLPQRVLVLRADQLGDLVSSIPALARLRELLPEAEITGLVTSSSAALARSLKLFDDLIVIDFRSDPVERRRLMPLDGQLELETELRARSFDLAIDLADASPSRYLLPLSGAKRIVGMGGGTYGFLDISFEAQTRNRYNGSEEVSASSKMLALVEWLGTAMARPGRTIRREDLSPLRLRAFGLDERAFVVLHTGARLQFSRWPHYPALARLLLERTALRVVLISDEPLSAARLGPGLIGHERIQLIERTLPFDDLDLLLSYCTAFVGNDSGPKHLASLRGSEVVSLHCARNNWNEWGQDNSGVIISRRLPCAGCQIRDYPDECGKDFVCMTAISPEEVLQAVLDRIDTRNGG